MHQPSRQGNRTSVPDLVIVALLVDVITNGAAMILGPQLVNCFGAVSSVSSPCLGCECRRKPYSPVPLLAFVQIYPVLSVALLVCSMLLAGVGFWLGRVVPGRLPVAGLQMLQFFPLITLALVGAISSILAFTVWKGIYIG